jgi:membrane dipeptidase
MKQLASCDGIMGLNACIYIVGCSSASKTDVEADAADTKHVLDAMCEHIEYVVQTIGASHIGFGFDLCDSYTAGKLGYMDVTSALQAASMGKTTFLREDCLQNHEEALLLTARLLERGMDEKSVLLIISQNWWNYFHSHLPKI